MAELLLRGCFRPANPVRAAAAAAVAAAAHWTPPVARRRRLPTGSSVLTRMQRKATATDPARAAGRALLSTQAGGGGGGSRQRAGAFSRKRRRSARGADVLSPPGGGGSAPVPHHHGSADQPSHGATSAAASGVATAISQQDLAAHARRTLSQVYAGVQDMEDSNPCMKVWTDEAGRVIIELGPEWERSFELEFDGKFLQLFSPLDMTLHTYQLNAQYDGWLCVDNGHQLLELLMRQLTGRFNGFPKF
eukprot:COSAG01_NODE_4671_length_4829_cov_27.390275_2_plen_248_part_00